MDNSHLPHAFDRVHFRIGEQQMDYCRRCGKREYDPLHVPAVQTATARLTPTAAWMRSRKEVEGRHFQVYDLVSHLYRQRSFSERAFGPDPRAVAVVDHIQKECNEILENPRDLEEWIDVALLAFDGAWRAGYSPQEIADAFEAKLAKNEQRKWPDWRTADPNKGIQHVKE